MYFVTKHFRLPLSLCRRPNGGTDRVGELVLLDVAGGFNLIHEPLPPPSHKSACKDFSNKYDKEIVRRAQEEEEKLAFKTKGKKKKKAQKDDDSREFFD